MNLLSFHSQNGTNKLYIVPCLHFSINPVNHVLQLHSGALFWCEKVKIQNWQRNTCIYIYIYVDITSTCSIIWKAKFSLVQSNFSVINQKIDKLQKNKEIQRQLSLKNRTIQFHMVPVPTSDVRMSSPIWDLELVDFLTGTGTIQWCRLCILLSLSHYKWVFVCSFESQIKSWNNSKKEVCFLRVFGSFLVCVLVLNIFPSVEEI